MKTIEEGARDSYARLCIHGADINELDYKSAFKIGAEFVNKWYSFKDNRPPYYKTCLVKVHEKTEPIAAWLANTGDSDIWTISSTDIILPPVKLWRPIF